MTSGFFFEDGFVYYFVNTEMYRMEDDKACFKRSRMFHNVNDFILGETYEIRRANAKINGYNLSIDFCDDGEYELRVYKVYVNEEGDGQC